MLPLVRLLVEEGAAETVAGIGAEQVDLTAARLLDQLVDALEGRQVDLQRLRVERRVGEGCVGGEQQIVAVLRGKLGELAADAGGSAGDDGELGHK